MVLEGVKEMWTELPKTGKGTQLLIIMKWNIKIQSIASAFDLLLIEIIL